MNREVHVRFWESPEVKVLRATRQSRHSDFALTTSGLHPKADISGSYSDNLPSSRSGPCGRFFSPITSEHDGPTMLAPIGIMKALNRHVERVFDPSRKHKHWGRRKLARDRN
jgi:hypothetical protein